jgi:hypothetical protein
MAAVNGIEWCTEQAILEMLALDSRLAGVAKVHIDDFRQATIDTIVAKSIAGEHDRAGCAPLHVECELAFHQGKRTQLDTAKAIGAIEGAIFRPTIAITTINVPELSQFKYFEILVETTSDRTSDTSKSLRNRVTKIPLLSLLL